MQPLEEKMEQQQEQLEQNEEMEQAQEAFEEEGDQRVIVGEEKLYLNEKEVAYSEIAHCYQLKHCFSIVYQGNHVYVIPKSVQNVEQAQELASLMQQKAPQAYHDLTQK